MMIHKLNQLGRVSMKGKLFFSSIFFTFFSVMVFSGIALGGAFDITPWMAGRASVLGPMFTAMADDPSANFYNPAGITQLQGTQVLAGFTLIKYDVNIKTDGNRDTEMNYQLFAPPHAYITKQVSDNVWLGFSITTPFGLGADYEWNSPVRYNVVKAKSASYNLNPNIAWKIGEKLSVSAGLDVMYATLMQQKAVNLGPFGDMPTKLDGDGWGVGYNVAIHFKPVNWASWGASYRSGINMDLDGDVNFEQPAAFKAFTGNMFFQNTTFKSRIKMPAQLYSGIALKPADTLTVGAGVIWTRWNNFNNMTVNYDTSVNTPVGSSTSSSVQKNWNDGWNIGGGVEWNATNWLDLRLGMLWDKSPIPDATADYLIPNNDRWHFMAGFGVHKDAWSVDVGYTYLFVKNRNITARPDEGVLNGSITDGESQLLSVSMGYKF